MFYHSFLLKQTFFFKISIERKLKIAGRGWCHCLPDVLLTPYISHSVGAFRRETFLVTLVCLISEFLWPMCICAYCKAYSMLNGHKIISQ